MSTNHEDLEGTGLHNFSALEVFSPALVLYDKGLADGGDAFNALRDACTLADIHLERLCKIIRRDIGDVKIVSRGQMLWMTQITRKHLWTTVKPTRVSSRPPRKGGTV